MSTAIELKNNIKWGYNLKIMQNLRSLTFNYFLPFPLHSKYHTTILLVNISEPFLPIKQVIRGQKKAKSLENHQVKGIFLPKAMAGFIFGGNEIQFVQERDIVIFLLSGCNSISTACDLIAPLLGLME